MEELYSKEEAEKIAQYYLPLIKGKIIEESTQALISTIEIESAGNSKFAVKAYANYNDNTRLKRSVFKVAALHSLPSPSQVLHGQDQ